MSDLLIAIIVYSICLLFIIIERIDKSIVAISGALILILTGVLTIEDAIHYVDFETILLLMGMMMIMYITHKSEIFSWLSTRIASLTKGNPLLIFMVFLSVTAVFSAFFDNVTTILIIVPITIAITRGMGLDPKVFVVSEILFSNIGGALTLIGDPPNILIGSAAKLSFNSFVVNLWIPVFVSLAVVLAILVPLHWKKIKPIKRDFVRLFLSHLLIKKIGLHFRKKVLKPSFIFVTLFIVAMTILGFVFQSQLHLEVGVIAMFGAMLLLIFTTQHVDLHETFNKVEWPTLFFFMGLFVLTGALEKTGALSYLSQSIISTTDNFAYLILIVLWMSGLVSMLVDNIPFVAVMIPIVFDIQKAFPDEPHLALLWWALSLGACFGGNGTLIGASANVVGVSLAEKDGVEISFLSYMKSALPLSLITLVIASAYLLIRLQF